MVRKRIDSILGLPDRSQNKKRRLTSALKHLTGSTKDFEKKITQLLNYQVHHLIVQLQRQHHWRTYTWIWETVNIVVNIVVHYFGLMKVQTKVIHQGIIYVVKEEK